ncbi:MAG: hypothetical protein HUU28_01180 [Planctomycetaceae bacterium]|nr:hypothetical protein [Planctomycetaceae bacterium]
MTIRRSPLSVRSSLIVLALLLPSCASSNGTSGTPPTGANSAAALSKLVREAAPLGIKLGQPPSPALLAQFGPKDWEKGDFQRWSACLLALNPSSEVYRVRALGVDPTQPVAAIEVTTVLERSVDREKLLSDAGVARKAWVGEWRGLFRPVKGELYGDHVFGVGERLDCYESTLDGVWLLIDAAGAFYGFVRAKDATQLERAVLTNTPRQLVREIEQRLARGEVVEARDLALRFQERAGAGIAPALQAVEVAFAERNAQLGAEAATVFAEWKARFDARAQGEERALRALLSELSDLCHRFQRIPEAEGWGAVVRAELSVFARERAASDRLGMHASVWGAYAADGAFTPQELVVALKAADRIEELASSKAVEEGWRNLLPSSLPSHVLTAMRARVPGVFAERLRREVGAPNEGPAVRTLALAMAESDTTDPTYYALQRMKDAQSLDSAFARVFDRPEMIGHLSNKLSSPLEGLNETPSWIRFRAQVPTIVRAEFVRRAEQARAWALPATEAMNWLSAAMVSRTSFPEPERLVDVLRQGSRDPDPLVANARNALAPLVARHYPPLHATVAHFERLEQLFRRLPIARFPAFWQLGLRLDSVAELREAARLAERGADIPWIQLVSDGIERLRVADVPNEPAPTPPDVSLAWLGFDLPPELRDEKAWINAEQVAIDAEAKRIAELKAAHDLAFAAHKARQDTFRASMEERLKAGQKNALENEARDMDLVSDRLREENEANNVAVRAFNARIVPFNERVTRFNDRYYFLLGDKTAQLDTQLNDALARWRTEHATAPVDVAGDALRADWTRKEATFAAEWFDAEDSPLPYDLRAPKRPSQGAANALIAELERSLWMQAGAKGIGEQLGLAIARDVELSGTVRTSLREALATYRGRFGAEALRAHLLTGCSAVERLKVVPALPPDVRSALGI